MTDRVCYLDGWLVNAKTRLPSDPTEFLPEQPEIFGCNRLKCRSCGQWVKSGAVNLGFPSGAKVDDQILKALYESDDWTTSPLLTKVSDERLYVCRCSYFETVVDSPLGGEKDSPNDPYVPWGCAGHPLVALPLVLGELRIDEATNWNDLVARILAGAAPRRLELGPFEEGPSTWLAWLYEQLAGLPVSFRSHLARAVAARLDDPNPVIRGTVLRFFSRFPIAEGVERVLAEATKQPARLAIGYPIPERWIAPTLWDVVIARLEHRPRVGDALDDEAIAIVQKALLTPIAELPHHDEGTLDLVETERERRRGKGVDVTTPAAEKSLTKYAAMLTSARSDVVSDAMQQYSAAFKDTKLREWMTDRIVAIDRKNPGRWRLVMNLLTDHFDKPDTGHLIVIAGMDVINSRAATVETFREWMRWRRANHGWMDEAWVMSLDSVLDEQARRFPPS